MIRCELFRVLPFRLGIQAGERVSSTHNCRSANSRPTLTDKYLHKEIKFGCVAGPFSSVKIEGLHISRFGIIPKVTPGKFCLIRDLSFPQGHSVNNLVPNAEAQVAYDSNPQAQNMLTKVGRGASIAKFDIERAYRPLFLHPSQRKFLGMKW